MQVSNMQAPILYHEAVRWEAEEVHCEILKVNQKRHGQDTVELEFHLEYATGQPALPSTECQGG